MSHFFKPLVKYSHIRELIVQGIGSQHVVGDRLPTENELAEQYAVSRETIRQALGQLEEEGLIERRRGKGTFIKRLPQAQRKRRLTGPIEREPDMTVAALIDKGFVTAPLEASWLEQSTDQVWRVRRLRSFESSPLVVHDAFVANSLISAADSVDPTASAMTAELETVLGKRLQETEHHIEAIAADRSVGPLLKISLGMPVLLLKRFYAIDQQPAVLFYSYYRTDRYYYSVKLESERLDTA